MKQLLGILFRRFVIKGQLREGKFDSSLKCSLNGASGQGHREPKLLFIFYLTHASKSELAIAKRPKKTQFSFCFACISPCSAIYNCLNEALPGGGGPRSLVGILKCFVSAFCQGSRRCRKLRDNYFSSLSLILG